MMPTAWRTSKPSSTVGGPPDVTPRRMAPAAPRLPLAGDLEHVDVTGVVAHVHQSVGVELHEVRAQHLILGRQVVARYHHLAGVGGWVPANHSRVLHVADVEPRLAWIPGDPPGLGQALAATARLHGRRRVGVQVPHTDAVVAGLGNVHGVPVRGDRDAAGSGHLVDARSAAAQVLQQRAGRSGGDAGRAEQLRLVEHLQAAARHVGGVDLAVLDVDALHAAFEHAGLRSLRSIAVHEAAIRLERDHGIVVVTDPDHAVAERERARIAEPVRRRAGRLPRAPLQLPGRAAGLRCARGRGVELLHALLERVDHEQRVVGWIDGDAVLLVEPAPRRRLRAGRPRQPGGAGTGALRGGGVGDCARRERGDVAGRVLLDAVVVRRAGTPGVAAPGLAHVHVALAVDRWEPDRVHLLMAGGEVGAVRVAPLVHELADDARGAGAGGHLGRVIGELVGAVPVRAGGVDLVVDRIDVDAAHVVLVALRADRADDLLRSRI